MKAIAVDRNIIRDAWAGRISGCQLGKPVELLSIAGGKDSLIAYLKKANAMPLRDYVPLIKNTFVDTFGRQSCKGFLHRSEPDDDITYSVIPSLSPTVMASEKFTTYAYYGQVWATIDNGPSVV